MDIIKQEYEYFQIIYSKFEAERKIAARHMNKYKVNKHPKDREIAILRIMNMIEIFELLLDRIKRAYAVELTFKTIQDEVNIFVRDKIDDYNSSSIKNMYYATFGYMHKDEQELFFSDKINHLLNNNYDNALKAIVDVFKENGFNTQLLLDYSHEVKPIVPVCREVAFIMTTVKTLSRNLLSDAIKECRK